MVYIFKKRKGDALNPYIVKHSGTNSSKITTFEHVYFSIHNFLFFFMDQIFKLEWIIMNNSCVHGLQNDALRYF